MKPSSIKKVFGIISYFPDEDSDYHIEMRKERTRRFKELLFKLEELWSEVDIMIIAQNWQDFQLPDIKNKLITYHYGKLGILGARKELRKRFLNSEYDYLIMLDDDMIVSSTDPQAFLDEIDKHPNGFGAIRKSPSPLPFFSISKYIYNQVELPDIDPEKGEGFEDDVFSATCFSRFPEAAFMFPTGLADDKSFHYDGPGKCPSTWSRERKYNWKYMREHTKDLIKTIEIPMVADETSEISSDKSIDLLITYVNGSDHQWVNDYITYTKTHNPSAVRFRSWGTLKYLLRGVAKYMPFIRNVVLIVARPSQVPTWINEKNVRIVYHDEFIPKKFLPTFNSCTIESFFWNIPDLTDRVIYFNDDMFPIKHLTEEDFFTGDIPNIKFTNPESYSDRAIFRAQCRSGIDLVTNALGLPKFEVGKIVRPYHISGSISKESRDKIKELCEDTLNGTITMLRNNKNVNQYIYSYYHYFTNKYVDKVVDYKYFELNDKTINDIMSEILNGSHHMVCLNDSEKLKNYVRVRYLLQTCFERKFTNKSKYEL